MCTVQYKSTRILVIFPMSKVLDRLNTFYHSLKNMKAIRVHKFGGPEVLKYETDVSIHKFGSSDILVNVKAVGINPVETYIRAGTYARKPQLPFTPGNDCAGIVEEVGSKVTDFKKGDRVYTTQTLTGAYAEFTISPSNKVHLLHSGLSFAQGAALSTPYLTAYRALFIRGAGKPGETVLVHGASGGVGVAAVQFARSCGMLVLGTAGTPEGIEIVKKAGAHFAFNHRSTDYLEDIKKAIKEKAIDVIVENASHINLGKDLTLLAKGGRVAVVGSRGQVEINPRDTMAREASISGVMLSNSSEKEFKESYAAIWGGKEAGWLRPIIGKEFTLENACQAHADIISGGGALGKTVLTVS